tara:strand:+ start:298 stop:1026 length:729 start_codon:yes stop_codon:yes gene_type:complete
MKIVIIHLGNMSECIVASSVNKALASKHKGAEITWIVADESIRDIFKYNRNVFKAYLVDEFFSQYEGNSFDLLIDLSPSDNYTDKIFATKKKGFAFESENSKYFNCIYKDTSLNMNLFQIYFRLAGLSWRGQGYDLSYKPKAKSKKKRVGLSIANAHLRQFVTDKLNLELSTLWVVPFKKNIFKKMDEINKCKTIVTDDFLTMHLSLYLRKYVYFLQTSPMHFDVELFGTGKAYKVPARYLR